MARRYAHLSGTGVLEFYKSFDDFAFKAKDPKEGFAVLGATGKVQPPAGDMRPETLFVSALAAAYFLTRAEVQWAMLGAHPFVTKYAV